MDYYYSFNKYLRKTFSTKVHRIGLNAGFTCPNRDGTLSRDGCIFCNEKGFSHFAGTALPLKTQIETSMDFLKDRFNAEKFIAYFQNATNTYAPIDKLRESYDTIRSFPDIVGLYISTRPDCIDREKLDLIESYSGDYDVWIEYGVQSAHDATLEKMGRSHTFSQSLNAIKETSRRKIKVGAHVILGLDKETKEDVIHTAETLAKLPISGVKFHALHVLRDTRLERLFKKGDIALPELSQYVGLVCDFMERLSPECVILRLVSDAKKEVLVAPGWINGKQAVIEEVKNEFKRRMTRQGVYYRPV